MKKTGVMIAGIRGATGSTLVATATALTRRPDTVSHPERFLLSEAPFARGLGLPALTDLTFGGWDVTGTRESWADTLDRHGVLDRRRHPGISDLDGVVVDLPAVVLTDDHAAVSAEAPSDAASGEALLARLRQDIRDFRAKTGAGEVTVLYVASPAKLPPPEQWPKTAPELLASLAKTTLRTAGPYYAAAAILERAAFADYTASATLEIPGLIDLAERECVPLAGRDGSTGQTLLKSVLAETFATRRLRIRGWYSTNILGNHDGLVLQDERFAEIKRHDKTDLLAPILGYAPDSHLVDIRHYLPAGDEKEAWDAIDFETWFGGRGQLRLNWRASDSLLATPPLLDLARFLAHARARGESGLQTHLGVFFKHPLGTDERRYLRLAGALEAYCHGRAAVSAQPEAPGCVLPDAARVPEHSR